MKVQRLWDQFSVRGFTSLDRYMPGAGTVVVHNTGPSTMIVSVSLYVEVPEELSDDLETTG